MDSLSLSSTSSLSSSLPLSTASLLQAAESDPVPPRHGASPVVAFIIGLAIVLLASVLNAAGLNLTKLDHVCFPHCTSVTPRTSDYSKYRYERARFRKLHEKRIGCDLYGFLGCCYTCIALPFGCCISTYVSIRLSQLIGSTLALEYMRAGELRQSVTQ